MVRRQCSNDRITTGTYHTTVEKQFKQSWRHKTTCPDLKVVYKIIAAEAIVIRYQQYLYEQLPPCVFPHLDLLKFCHSDSVEARGNFEALGKSRGNEHRRWHGTKRKCTLGDPGNKTFCADQGCSLCCIIETSFNLKYFKAATGWGRFGRGIYTSSTPPKFAFAQLDDSVNLQLTLMFLPPGPTIIRGI